jgi:hypothetical protein
MDEKESRLSRLQGEVDETKKVLEEVAVKAEQRGPRIKRIEEQAATLNDSANRFEQTQKKNKNRDKWHRLVCLKQS